MTSIASPVCLMSQSSSRRSPSPWCQYILLIYVVPLSATFVTCEVSRVRFHGPRERMGEASFTHPPSPSQTLHQGAWMTPRDAVPLSLISRHGGGRPYYCPSRALYQNKLVQKSPRPLPYRRRHSHRIGVGSWLGRL